MSFNQFILKEQYGKIKGLGDRLQLMDKQIDWEKFRPLIKQVFYDDKCVGGRPHTDEIIIAKTLVLQACYNLSDTELEFQICDRLSFRNFLGFPENIIDFSTIWKIRERLIKANIEQKIWDELQKQLDAKGYTIKKGVIQDATFIEADVGRKRYQEEKKTKKEGKKIEYSEKQLQHINKDGSFSVKNGQVHFGYKSHIKSDVDNQLIRAYEVSTASLHDGDVDLIGNGDCVAYRDKGYFGKKLKAKNVKDMTMKRNVRNKKLNGGELRRNSIIARVRCIGERPFSVIKYVFHGGYTFVKTLKRVSIKEMFKCFSFNLYQLVTLKRRG